MTIKHPITGERTGYFDENATALKVGDTVELFGQNGTVTFDANNSVYITGIGKDENGEPKQIFMDWWSVAKLQND